MARMSTPWRALRPAILAGAAAVTWLTLSSAAASADTTPDSSSLLGSVSSSVSTLNHDLADTVPPVPAGSQAGPAAPQGLLQPVMTPVSALADNLIAAVPVVDQVVPAGTVSAVSAPVAELADSMAAGMGQGVVTPAAENVPVLEPVLQPVSDFLTGAAPLPVPPLEAVQSDVPEVLAPAPAENQPAAVEETQEAVETAPETDHAVEAPSLAATADGNGSLESAGLGVRAKTAAPQSALSVQADSVSEQPLAADPWPLPAQAPAAPASGTGSAGSSGGPSGAAAWLDPFDFGFEPAGTVPAGDTSEHAPAPVSFDPGSSPD